MLLSRPPKDGRLAPFIKALWTCEISNGCGLERVLPNGRTQLFINLYQDVLHNFDPSGRVRQKASGMAVQGPADAPVVIDCAEQRELCGVVFSVGGAFAFFGESVSSIGSGLVDVSCLSWTDQWALHDRLRKARDPAERLDQLEAAFVKLSPISQHWDVIVRQASTLLQSGVDVRTVANHFATSQQTLITRFRERTGLTPKTFSRIERFQHLVLNQDPKTSWVDAALDAGFSDQSHMVREFRRFAGISPTKYQPNSENQRNHIAFHI